MRTATTVEGSAGNWPEIAEFVREAEKMGLDICWVRRRGLLRAAGCRPGPGRAYPG